MPLHPPAFPLQAELSLFMAMVCSIATLGGTHETIGSTAFWQQQDGVLTVMLLGTMVLTAALVVRFWAVSTLAIAAPATCLAGLLWVPRRPAPPAPGTNAASRADPRAMPARSDRSWFFHFTFLGDCLSLVCELNKYGVKKWSCGWWRVVFGM